MKPQLDSLLYGKQFFPRSVITTYFGWDIDTFPGAPRIHPAIDRAGKEMVSVPVDASSCQWIDTDAQGCSVLRLFFPNGEIRMMHFLVDELDSGIVSATAAKTSLSKGSPIAPAGNKGISVSKTGGDGRHVHYALILKPGGYDDQLHRVIGDGWNSDRSSDWRSRYGSPFIRECKNRGIMWMNQYVIARRDPYYGGNLMFHIDPLIFYM